MLGIRLAVLVAGLLIIGACAPATRAAGSADPAATAASGITLRLIGLDRTEAFLTWSPRGRLGSVQIQWLVNGTQAGIDRVPAAAGRATRRFPGAVDIAAILTFEGELPVETSAVLVRPSP